MFWQSFGGYEYEVGPNGCYTGWCRCVGGRGANGIHIAWHEVTGVTRPS